VVGNIATGRKYSSRIDLPPKVYKLEEIKAQMNNGVLKVTVPKFTKAGRRAKSSIEDKHGKKASMDK